MAEAIKHECGIAMVRLLKPLSYYQKKYGTYLYGFMEMYLILNGQHSIYLLSEKCIWAISDTVRPENRGYPMSIRSYDEIIGKPVI